LEPRNRRGRVRPSRVGEREACRLKRGLNDERVNNNFGPIQSCRASHSMWEWSGASNYIHYWVSFHPPIQTLSK
jgi:hypothetical protein